MQNDNFAKDYTVAWNTEPIIGNALTALWTDYWSAATWIAWHKAVMAKYGQQRANEVLIQWWNKAPIASPTTDFRTMDDDFINYAKKNGFYDALFGGILGIAGKTVALGTATVEGAKNVISGATDVIGTIGGIGKNLKWYLIAAIVIFIVFKFVKK